MLSMLLWTKPLKLGLKYTERAFCQHSRSPPSHLLGWQKPVEVRNLTSAIMSHGSLVLLPGCFEPITWAVSAMWLITPEPQEIMSWRRLADGTTKQPFRLSWAEAADKQTFESISCSRRVTKPEHAVIKKAVLGMIWLKWECCSFVVLLPLTP